MLLKYLYLKLFEYLVVIHFRGLVIQDNVQN
ncbi:hypothetical protein CoNPh35_CDS0042 [Staphylococcus phage S-CoN_Ph35]|nr:hypothetical protein CoNPh35_CDS0042 [Staphylococcus phage S-CoN_Ph35]